MMGASVLAVWMLKRVCVCTYVCVCMYVFVCVHVGDTVDHASLGGCVRPGGSVGDGTFWDQHFDKFLSLAVLSLLHTY